MPEEIKEEKELLERKEIRTMRKDIARLREIEAQKERDRIAALRLEEIKKERQKITPPEIEKPKVSSEALIPKPLPKKPSPFKKALVRGIICAVLLLILGSLIWFFVLKKPVEEEDILPTEEEIIPSGEIIEKPEISIPPSLISVAETKTSEISQNEEIPEAIRQLMAEELPLGTFTRIVIKNARENRLSSLEDLAGAFQVEAPEEIFQKLGPDYTLALYSQEQGKRVAFVTKVKEKSGLIELLKVWETKLREGIFVSGEEIPALVPYFKEASFEGITFRYLTISRQDLGICYLILDDYFVLATSFESLKKVIKEVESLSLIRKSGQLFIVGFEGKALTPQLEDLFKKYQPGGVLLLSKNIESKEQLKSLIGQLQELSLEETSLPLLVAVDQEGGFLSRIEFLQEKTSQSEIENSGQAYQVGLKRGEELKELGVNLKLAPILDLTNEGDFLFNRSFQKSAEEIGNLAKALVLGQKETGILTAIKHFPGYGGISFNPEEKLATTEKTPEISQFKKAIEANPEMVMVSNAVYQEIDPSLPFAFSPQAIQFLKNNLGSEILIISDDLSQNSLLENFTLKEIITKPIEAGIDVLIFSGWRSPVAEALEIFSEAVKNGEISEEKINQLVSKIIQLKKELL